MRFFIFIKSLFLDHNEKKYLKIVKHQNKSKKKENVLLLIPNDYYYVCYNYIISNERLKNYNIYGYWPYFLHLNKKRKIKFFEKLHEFKSNTYFNFLKNKFKKLYKPIGLKDLFDFSSISRRYLSNREFLRAKNQSERIFRNLKNKKDVLNLNISSIYCGDLIYDTYIRFRNRPTVDINDDFLKKIIFKSIVLIISAKKYQREFQFKYFYTTYATYIFYGILVRSFLKDGVIVYSGCTIAQYNKKLSVSNHLHVENYKKFKKIFKKLKNKKEKLVKSKSLLNKIFYGRRKNIEFMDYMNVNPFSKNFKKLNKKIDGVIFLPNFFESQREWGKLIFLDFFDWINFTCKIINDYNLNIAIKPHPNIFNVNTESIEVVNYLKKKYSKLVWIDPFTSNLDLFKKIKFGVSPWGTVLWELSYFNVTPISAGEHPACKYNIGCEPQNKNEYKKMLINGHLLKRKIFSKNNILELCYMYFIHNLDSYQTKARKINLNQLDFSNSKSLIKFFHKMNKL